MNKEHQESLINKINKIKNDTNTSNVIKSSDTMTDGNSYHLYSTNILDYDESDGELHAESVLHISKSNREKLSKTDSNIE